MGQLIKNDELNHQIDALKIVSKTEDNKRANAITDESADQIGDVAERIGENLRIHLQQQGLQAAELAEAVGVGKNTISRLLTGQQKTAQWNLLWKICEYLLIDLQTLLSDGQVDLADNTGIPVIDERVRLVSLNLFRGIVGYNKIKDFFTPDYHLFYGGFPYGDKRAKGPTLIREMELNAVNTVTKIELLSIDIVDQLIHSRLRQTEVVSRGAMGLPNGLQTSTRSHIILDIYKIDTTIKRIVAGKPWKISARWIKTGASIVL